MDKSTFSLKNKLLRILPPFLGKILYSINHKTVIYSENKFSKDPFSICIPHTMMTNYTNGHEKGVALLIQNKYSQKHSFVFFDIGSCFGYFSGLISELNIDSEIHAFEPYIGHYMYIEKSIKKGFLKNLTLVKTPAGDSDSEKIITIDRYVAEKNKVPELIKIDVDGAEIEILEGCKSVINNYSPDFLIEIDGNKYKKNGANLAEIKATYFDGYTCSVLLNVHKNNTIWNEKDIQQIDLKKTEGDIYLHLTKK